MKITIQQFRWLPVAVVGISLALAGVSAHGAEGTLQQYLQEQVTTLSDSLSENDDGVCTEVPSAREEAWLFRRFFLRIRPNVTFTAGIASIGIVPDIELMWERPIPEGWADYRPAYE